MTVSIVATELRSLYDSHGHLSPALVVDAARDPDSPLHPRFEWDDSTAAERYRVFQAAHLIRSVKVEIVRHHSGPRRVREFIHIPTPKPGSGDEDAPSAGYVPQDVVAASPEMSRIALREMERRWKELRRSYQDHVEFWDMVRRDVPAAS